LDLQKLRCSTLLAQADHNRKMTSKVARIHAPQMTPVQNENPAIKINLLSNEVEDSRALQPF